MGHIAVDMCLGLSDGGCGGGDGEEGEENNELHDDF